MYSVVVSDKEGNVTLASLDVNYDAGDECMQLRYSFVATSTEYSIRVFRGSSAIAEIPFTIDTHTYEDLAMSQWIRGVMTRTDPSVVYATNMLMDVRSIDTYSFVIHLPLGLLLSPSAFSVHSSPGTPASSVLTTSCFAVTMPYATTVYLTPLVAKAGNYSIGFFIHNVLFRANVVLTVQHAIHSPQYVSWGTGLVGGKTTDTLHLYVKKTDTFGNV